MASGGDEWERQYPLHCAVWNNNVPLLQAILQQADSPLEAPDPRGRSALMLAVTLGRLECARVLLHAGADANTQNTAYWFPHSNLLGLTGLGSRSLSHEAVGSGDPELLQLVLHHREAHRAVKTKQATARLLAKLQDTADFYAEMSWEFASWLPFVANMCPSDTYKVYKCGHNVRVDATLIGFDGNNQWQRGRQSFLFKGSDDGESLQIIVVDHDAKVATCDTVTMSHLNDTPDKFAQYRPSEEEIASRLTSPIVTTYIDIDKIAFERSKTGFFWKGDKAEIVNEYPCKVFSAWNVELVTKTRKEHLSQRDRDEVENRNATPMDSLLKFVQGAEVQEADGVEASARPDSLNPNGLSLSDYLDTSVDLLKLNRDIGRPKEVSKRGQNFKATLWLSEEFPLSLQEQITPIIDLMAVNNAHFQRLKNFIELQLPAGFPVKIEIPLFHVVNAKITFGNINALRRPVAGVTTSNPGTENQKCIFAPEIFEIPPAYRLRSTGSPRHKAGPRRDEEDLILQWAIQQSLREETGDLLPDDAPIDTELQRAIQASLGLGSEDKEGGGLSAVLAASRAEEEVFVC